VAGESKEMDLAGAYSTTAIKSFTATGFTLGTSSGVNTSGATYYFVAFKAGTDLIVGTYPGDGGTQSITGLGFSPNMVIVFSNYASVQPAWRNSAMVASYSNRFGGHAVWSNYINTFEAGGFTVGSNQNVVGTTYHYAAFKGSTALQSGTFAGAAGANKTITTTGMTPQFVMMCVDDGTVSVWPVMKIASMAATSSVIYTATASTTNDIIGFAAGSFTVKNGSAQANSTSDPNYYTAFGAGGSLPIELQDFKVACKNGKAEISWVTTTETNNNYFTVERTEDGNDFETVATVVGAGNSIQSRYYSLTDSSAFSKSVYYRLKQTDYDGKSEYFNLISFDNCHLISGLDVNLYPNPLADEISYQFNLEASAHITIEIFDVLGKSIYSKELDVNKGNHLLKIDLSGISKGMYVFKISDGTAQILKKITKR